MKQFITALVISLSLTASATSNPVLSDKTPAKNTLHKHEGRKDELIVLPNPKTGNPLVSFKSDKAGKGIIVVLDESGNTVLKQQVKLTAGKNKISINNSASLQEGYYTVCVNTNYKTYSAPFLLWK